MLRKRVPFISENFCPELNFFHLIKLYVTKTQSLKFVVIHYYLMKFLKQTPVIMSDFDNAIIIVYNLKSILIL